MKAAILDNHKITVKDIVDPKTGENEIKIRMKACGICGSDLEKVFGKYGMKSSKIGHEPVGEIEEVGNSIREFKKGDRVFIHHHVPCHICRYCMAGDFTMCDKYQSSNIEPCGLSEFIFVPEWNILRGGVVKIPDSMNYYQASLIEPLACCLRSINKLQINKGDSIVIFGAGPTGLMHLMLCRVFGTSRIVLLDINDFRLEFAKKICPNVTTINVETVDKEVLPKLIYNAVGAEGADYSITCTSSPSAFLQAMEFTRRGGGISLFGVPPKETEIGVDLNKIYSKELRVIPSYATSEKEIHQAISLMQNKIVDMEQLITHKFRISESNKALECAHGGHDSMKIIIVSE
ncbi:MAG TPA: alcohol dehydrogenase catalytic domain-containing protein [Candidatus Nitrosocosmicus sp.]|nr:alcohol dehydrogenase catalytic domain-containing protein [Candidatus Nitrosocosmicus sp.]